MIQRIQSIYLLLAAILMAVTAFSPILYINGGDTLFSYGIEQAGEIIKPTWGIVTMAGLSALLSLAAIFFFKNRKRQGNIALLSLLVIVLYYITTIVYMVSYYNDFFSVVESGAYAICFPIIALIFVLLASRQIKKDEKLVRSLDRIR